MTHNLLINGQLYVLLGNTMFKSLFCEQFNVEENELEVLYFLSAAEKNNLLVHAQEMLTKVVPGKTPTQEEIDLWAPKTPGLLPFASEEIIKRERDLIKKYKKCLPNFVTEPLFMRNPELMKSEKKTPIAQQVSFLKEYPDKYDYIKKEYLGKDYKPYARVLGFDVEKLFGYRTREMITYAIKFAKNNQKIEIDGGTLCSYGKNIPNVLPFIANEYTLIECQRIISSSTFKSSLKSVEKLKNKTVLLLAEKISNVKDRTSFINEYYTGKESLPFGLIEENIKDMDNDNKLRYLLYIAEKGKEINEEMISEIQISSDKLLKFMGSFPKFKHLYKGDLGVDFDKLVEEGELTNDVITSEIANTFGIENIMKTSKLYSSMALLTNINTQKVLEIMKLKNVKLYEQDKSYKLNRVSDDYENYLDLNAY